MQLSVFVATWSVKLLGAILRHHHDCLIRLRHVDRWLLDHHGLLCLHLHLHLLLLHWHRHRHLLLSLILRLIISVHGFLAVRLLSIGVRIVSQHKSLDTWGLSILAILHEHRCVGRASRDLEVFVLSSRLFQILFDSFPGEFFLCISHFTKIGSPCGQSKTNDEVEEG